MTRIFATAAVALAVLYVLFRVAEWVDGDTMNQPPLWAWVVMTPVMFQWVTLIAELFQQPAPVEAGKFYELHKKN